MGQPFRGQKHVWAPPLTFYADISTCGGCGAQAQRVTVDAISKSIAVEGEHAHKIVAWKFRAGPASEWRGVWRMPPCTRPKE